MWSSQRYLKEGRALRIDEKVLLAAVAEINRISRSRPSIPPILSLGHLAKLSGVSYETLRACAERSLDESYRTFFIRKRTGGYRKISVPRAELKQVQAWIATKLLRVQPVHSASHAFSPFDSTIKCASVHCGAKWLIKMDIADFFGSITEIQVYRVFQNIGYNRLISFEMARLCTDKVNQSGKYDFDSWKVKKFDYKISYYQQRVFGRLPQGAPTSPMLANLVMFSVDEEIANIASQNHLLYTRYSDDLTFSTSREFSRQSANSFIDEVAKILKKYGLFPNKKKTTVVPPGARKIVLGLLVDRATPALTREFKDKIRQHLFYLLKPNGLQQHLGVRGFDSIGGLYRHLLGLINYANMVDPVFSEKMKIEFDKVAWPGQL